MKGNLILGAIMFVICVGCNYDTNDQFVNTIQPPRPELAIVTLDGGTDTINVAQDVLLHFTAETRHTLVGTEVYFNHQKLYSLAGTVNTFQLSTDAYSTGYYLLELELTTVPATGSLSNLEGSEKFTTWQTFIIFVDKLLPEKSQITSIATEDGTLRIRWTESNDPNFQAYELRKYVRSPFSGKYEIYDTLHVSDPHKLYVDDPYFVGDEARYRLRVMARGRYSDIAEKEYKSSWNPMINFRWIDETTVEVKWRKNPYYANISTIEFSPVGKPGEITSDVEDTVCIFSDSDFRFGETLAMQLKITPKSEAKRFKVFQSTLYKGMLCHKQFFNAKYNKANDTYIAFKHSSEPGGSDSLFLFKGDYLNPIKEIKLSRRAIAMNFSPDGSKLFLLFGDQLVLFNPITLETIQQYSFSTLPDNFKSTSDSKLFISDNGLAVISFWHDAVIDLNTMTVIFETNGEILSLAPDGSQLCVNGARYPWNGSTFTSTTQYYPSAGINRWSYSQPSVDTLAIAGDQYLVICDAVTRALLKSYPVNSAYCEYDHENKVLYVFGTKLECRNLITNTSQYILAQGPFRQINKNLVCDKGFYLKLD